MGYIVVQVGSGIAIDKVYASYDLALQCLAQLNAAVGGVPDSQHLNGEAVDIVVPDKEVVAQWIIDNLDFDQLIIEPTWLHISYKKNGNRKEVLNYK
jgi:hypothetical protein